ncbi:hypothetical protein B296_00005701 [Ensete ventricosum]|uniref:Uncharacterized protein n=1 Tax=Ensete ventricosum TaxID=4639 RepID=A0A426XA88_ENSVE|nr:hypothetical protein B296_00005701 [Ensete ventricosum]
MGGSGTPVTHRQFTRRSFPKSGSLHFANFGWNLMLTNPLKSSVADFCVDRLWSLFYALVLGAVWVLESGYDDSIVRLEECPIDNMVGGSKIGRVLGVWEKKNDKEMKTLQ